MAKVFTITEGLQNLGALKTGGQGSVYKAKRMGELITAVKLLPTPIFNESHDDRNYATFQNEVEKLKRVNEEPNPNVVKIISSGITESGSLPFIEMEFIEGPDMEELLKPPHPPVFTVKEAVKVAEHLSNALSHCHRLNVKHGDIKSNNVKFNLHSGNYVLLDFGLAVMSDEQRRTSLRQAGAIEFMAPEQREGTVLFQTDVYSFGVILFELLAGTVPFPLRDKTDMARNLVMLAHMEQPVPDLAALRREHLPADWDEEKKAAEMQIPSWLTSTIYRCLEKTPDSRFANGVQLHNHIIRNSTLAPAANDGNGEMILQLQRENSQLQQEKKELQALVQQYQQQPPPPPQQACVPTAEMHRRSSSSSIILASIITAVVVATILFFALRDNRATAGNNTAQTADTSKPLVPYRVLADRAYFHNEPDPATRRSAFIPVNASLEGRDERNGFVYTEYTNSRGQTSKGWLKREELITAEEWNTSQSLARQKEEETRNQLRQANAYIATNQFNEAVTIYRNLTTEDVPEALYQYAALALQNRHAELGCAEALAMLEKAGEKGYAPAKRTLGFLYVFAENRDVLGAAGYERCTFQKNVIRGTQLLVQAVRDGDSTARDIIDDINKRRELEGVGTAPPGQ